MSAMVHPRSLAVTPRLDRWLAIGEQETVLLRTGKVEIGQGIVSALAQLAADELDVDYSRIRMVGADTDGPNEGVTAGSKSVEDSGGALRFICAEVRQLFLQAAAEKLAVTIDQLSIQDGTIRKAGSNQTTSYWELADSVVLDRDVTYVTPKQPAVLRITGASLPRIDIPAKVYGTAAFIQDIELPGMLYGRIVRPASYDARLDAYETGSIESMPGVVAVVRDGNFLGVVARREEQAIKAAEKLGQAATWAESPTLPESEAAFPSFLYNYPHTDRAIGNKGEDFVAADQSTKATYSRPFIAHASIGPCCAVAHWTGNRLDVWSHSQSIFPLRKDLARVLDVTPESICIRHVPNAGCYGHNGADDVALDAALLARAVPGQPVKLQWSREDEFKWDLFGPAMAVRLSASLEDGQVATWHHELWSPPHIMRPSFHPTPSLLAGHHIAHRFDVPEPVDTLAGTENGASQRNATPCYDFASYKVVQHVLKRLPVRSSTLRGIGAFMNVFAIESFLDELAADSGDDPVVFRTRHLSDGRAVAVIRKVAAMAGWPGQIGEGRALGLGFARYKNDGGYAAVVVDVEVDDTVRLIHAYAAVDCGRVVNAGGLANQVSGGVVQAASWTLKEQVTFDSTRVTCTDWETYPILTFREAPQVDVELIDQPDEPSVGSGEIVVGPTAAAIANAVNRAVGVRVRNLPITRDRILAVINS